MGGPWHTHVAGPAPSMKTCGGFMACATILSIVWETEKSNQPSNLMKCSPDGTLQGPGEGCASFAPPAGSVLLTSCGREALFFNLKISLVGAWL